uniref:Lipoprotein n=1 Tax=uncultured gamma proteobacterium HF0010_11B23 TaxID=710979 RepID=E0XQS5_9GAMM|nr:hypothetical protein [uncultured gamma proteobacterium HF0010_11B23]
MFTRNLLLLIILSSCSIASIDTSNLDFDDSFSNSDKFQFNKCLRNTSEKIKLNDLQFNYLAENINSQGLEFNTRYILSLTMKTQNSDVIELDSKRLNTTNYISSNMADSEKKEIKKSLIADVCKLINNYVK